MLRIGITGGIGSGKTTICRVFELLGIPVFYADAVAKQVMQTDTRLIAEVKLVFGEESYFESGLLNRKHIASKVFADVVELEKLNAIVHPAVFRVFDSWVDKQQNAPYVLKEAALLYESNSYKDCKYSVLVKSPLDLRIKRVMQRDNTTEEEVKRRMAKQWSDEQKEKLADFTLDNNEIHFLIPEVLKLHKRFLEESIQ